MMIRHRLPGAMCTLAVTLLSTTANAALVVPTDLSSGDAYRVIFVSSEARDANSTNILDYDASVQTLANTAGIGGDLEWKAIASTTTVSALDHITSFVTDEPDIPIYNQMGEQVAATSNDLWSGISNAIVFDEYGAVAHAGVWTGSDADGTALIGYELGTESPGIGLANSTTNTWLSWTTSPDNADLHNLYALSGTVIVSAVPIPAAIWLFASGLIGLFAATHSVTKRRNNF